MRWSESERVGLRWEDKIWVPVSDGGWEKAAGRQSLGLVGRDRLGGFGKGVSRVDVVRHVWVC